MTTKSHTIAKEETLRREYEEPGPSFLRIMVSEQLLEENSSSSNLNQMHSPYKDNNL